MRDNIRAIAITTFSEASRTYWMLENKKDSLIPPMRREEGKRRNGKED